MPKFMSFLPYALLLTSFMLAGCEPTSDSEDNDDDSTPENTTISLSFLSRYETNSFDESAAEIVAFDTTTKQIFVVNADSGLVDVLDINSPSSPTLASSLALSSDIANAVAAVTDPSELGAANSVAVFGNTVAVAVEADNKQDNGYIAFYQTDGTFLSAIKVGALPDMVTFTPDGETVLVANEGEPSDDYNTDPEGTVTVIDVSGGASSVTSTNVTTVSFTDFNTGGSRADELSSDVRVSTNSASVAQDFEPEYIAVSADSTTAWVALQENNAIVEIDLSDNSITSILGLGYKDHSVAGNELDASNRDSGVNIQTWPLRGLYMPDSIDVFESNGVNYIVTANEGDSREYDNYVDEIRLADIIDSGESDATINISNLNDFAVDIDTLAEDENLGRIKIVTNLGVTGCETEMASTGQPTSNCTYDELYTFGARSFTIWNAETGAVVFDSGSDFEAITASELGADAFNATNDENGSDDRSDDKGPEPEAVEIATIGNNTYAFIGLERVSAIMVYDITTPESASFLQILSTRDHSVDIETLVDAGDFTAAGDLGPESILYVSAEDSPSDEALLIVGNEVSGTTTIYQIEEEIVE